MKTDSFNRKKRQFRNLANRVNHLIFKGEWEKLSTETRNRLILKLNLMFRELSRFFSQFELKKILAAAAIFISLPLVSQSQSFAPPQLNPFGLVPDSVDFASPDYADIDNDDDYDLFSGNYGGVMQFYENTGTAVSPLFALPQQNPFGIPPLDSYVVFPAFADIDDDGDLDLLIGILREEEEQGDFEYFENIGTVDVPSFASPQFNPFGLTPPYLFGMPEFADIDNDGDLDLFAGEGYGIMKFYENTGDHILANFASPISNPFGITPAPYFGSPAFSDIDHDGDLDLFEGEYYGNLLYFENTGTVTSPVFAPVQINPFGLAPTNYYNFPAIADLDNDGDDDILSGVYGGSFQYFENTEFNIGIGENNEEASFDLYPNPSTDGVYITLNDDNPGEFIKVIITDISGRIVKTENLIPDDLRLKTDDLSSGVYFVRLEQGDKYYTKKLIIR